MTVSGKIVELKAIHSMPYPFANFPNQCSYADYLNFLFSNPYFQGKIGSDLEAAHPKAKWKRRWCRQ